MRSNGTELDTRRYFTDTSSARKCRTNKIRARARELIIKMMSSLRWFLCDMNLET